LHWLCPSGIRAGGGTSADAGKPTNARTFEKTRVLVDDHDRDWTNGIVEVVSVVNADQDSLSALDIFVARSSGSNRDHTVPLFLEIFNSFLAESYGTCNRYHPQPSYPQITRREWNKNHGVP
jgi:hypothetical protein